MYLHEDDFSLFRLGFHIHAVELVIGRVLVAFALEDFLDGNYTIEAIEPDQKFQPESGENRLDSGLDVLIPNPISKVGRYKKNLEKDLERKYNEYSQLLRLLYQYKFKTSLNVDLDDETTLSPIEIEYYRKVKIGIEASSLSVLLLYDSIIHTMLFKHWSWKEDKEQIEKQGLSYQNHNAEEIYNALSRINCSNLDLGHIPCGQLSTKL